MAKENHNLPKNPPEDSSGEQDTQQRILAAALSEFTEHGIGGARVDRIARAAGVNKALLYYYFDSKQKLYEESLKTVFADVLATIKEGLVARTDLEQVLQATAGQYLNVFLTRSEIASLVLRELADTNSEPIAKLAATIAESAVPQRLAEFLREGKAAGTVRETIDERQAIVSFITMQIGYFLMRPMVNRVIGIEDDRQFLVDRKDAVVDLFLNGVKAR